MRPPIDKGASVSLIGEEQYNRLRIWRWLRRPDIEISQVDGKPVTIKGMVRLRSESSWSFPIVVVDKKDGGVDFSKLNAVSKPLTVPLLLIDDILTLLGRAKYFSTIDLRSGYWQVALYEADKEKAAFACHMDWFQLRVMPLGLANAPGIFSS